MPDSITVSPEREPVEVERTGLDRIPDWLQFPALIFAISCVMAFGVSFFAPNVWPAVIPIGLVCGLVAISNLVAIRLHIDANKS